LCGFGGGDGRIALFYDVVLFVNFSVFCGCVLSERDRDF